MQTIEHGCSRSSRTSCCGLLPIPSRTASSSSRPLASRPALQPHARVRRRKKRRSPVAKRRAERFFDCCTAWLELVTNRVVFDGRRRRVRARVVGRPRSRRRRLCAASLVLPELRRGSRARRTWRCPPCCVSRSRIAWVHREGPSSNVNATTAAFTSWRCSSAPIRATAVRRPICIEDTSRLSESRCRTGAWSIALRIACSRRKCYLAAHSRLKSKYPRLRCGIELHKGRS
jgi:hypothetical protein